MNLVPVQVMNEDSGENRLVATAKFLFGDKSELSPYICFSLRILLMLYDDILTEYSSASELSPLKI